MKTIKCKVLAGGLTAQTETGEVFDLTTQQTENEVIECEDEPFFQVWHEHKGWINADPSYTWHSHLRNRYAFKPIVQPITTKEDELQQMQQKLDYECLSCAEYVKKWGVSTPSQSGTETLDQISERLFKEFGFSVTMTLFTFKQIIVSGAQWQQANSRQ